MLMLFSSPYRACRALRYRARSHPVYCLGTEDFCVRITFSVHLTGVSVPLPPLLLVHVCPSLSAQGALNDTSRPKWSRGGPTTRALALRRYDKPNVDGNRQV